MEAVASRFRDNVRHTASHAAEFGFGIVRNNLELLHQVNIRQDDICRAADIGIDDAVKEIKL